MISRFYINETLPKRMISQTEHSFEKNNTFCSIPFLLARIAYTVILQFCVFFLCHKISVSDGVLIAFAWQVSISNIIVFFFFFFPGIKACPQGSFPNYLIGFRAYVSPDQGAFLADWGMEYIQMMCADFTILDGNPGYLHDSQVLRLPKLSISGQIYLFLYIFVFVYST